jgi:hypothetical protein
MYRRERWEVALIAHDLDGSHKIVLVTQGTVANHNFAY